MAGRPTVRRAEFLGEYRMTEKRTPVAERRQETATSWPAPSGWWPRITGRIRARVAELAALFAATDRCRYCSEVPFRHLVMPVLFRTIYACGLRCSEARLLRVCSLICF